MFQKIAEKAENLIYPELRPYGRSERARLLKQVSETPFDLIEMGRNSFRVGGRGRPYPLCHSRLWAGQPYCAGTRQFLGRRSAARHHGWPVSASASETWTALAAQLGAAFKRGETGFRAMNRGALWMRHQAGKPDKKWQRQQERKGPLKGSDPVNRHSRGVCYLGDQDTFRSAQQE